MLSLLQSPLRPLPFLPLFGRHFARILAAIFSVIFAAILPPPLCCHFYLNFCRQFAAISAAIFVATFGSFTLFNYSAIIADIIVNLSAHFGTGTIPNATEMYFAKSKGSGSASFFLFNQFVSFYQNI